MSDTCGRCGEQRPEVYDLRRRLVPWLPWHRKDDGRWCAPPLCSDPRGHPMFCKCVGRSSKSAG